MCAQGDKWESQEDAVCVPGSAHLQCIHETFCWLAIVMIHSVCS